jgi:hypothetical protein
MLSVLKHVADSPSLNSYTLNARSPVQERAFFESPALHIRRSMLFRQPLILKTVEAFRRVATQKMYPLQDTSLTDNTCSNQLGNPQTKMLIMYGD